MEVTKKHRFLYGFGYMGVLMAGIMFNTFASFYYIQYVKLNPAWVGVGFGVVSAWEALIAPFVGYFSDRTRTRWGRRKPYVVIGIPIIAIFLWLLFNPAFDASQPVLAMGWFMVTLFIIDSTFMVVDVNWQAVNAEMNADLASRSQQGAIVGVFSMLGVAVVAGVTLPLAGKFGWPTTSIIIGLAAIVIGYLGVFGLKENPKLLRSEVFNLKDSVRYTLGYKPSRFYMGLSIIIKIAMFSVTTMIPLFALWVLGVTEGESGILLLACSGGMLLVFPIAAVVINKIGPRKGFITGFIPLIAVTAVLLMPITNFTLLLVLFALLSVGFTLLMLSQMIMLSDLIDADALKVGQRREGIYNSANALVQRLGAFVFSIVMGFALNASGFKSTLSVQSSTTLLAIKGLLAGIPLLVCVLGLIVLIKYPITDEQAKEIRNQAKKQREDFESVS